MVVPGLKQSLSRAGFSCSVWRSIKQTVCIRGRCTLLCTRPTSNFLQENRTLLLRQFFHCPPPYYYRITKHRVGANFPHITLLVCNSTGRHIKHSAQNFVIVYSITQPYVKREIIIIINSTVVQNTGCLLQVSTDTVLRCV